MAVTRNQSEGDSTSSTPMQSLSTASYSRKSTLSRIDLTTNLSFWQIIALGMLASVVLQASLAYLVMNDKIKLHGRATVQSLTNFGARIEYVLRYQAFNVLWLVITTVLVIAGRISTGAVNPLEGYESIILAAKQVHTNSVEQFLLLFVNQLILATNLAPDLFLRVIPLINVLFFIARVLFWLGYPKYRTAGFTAGMTPIGLATLYNTYALINYIF